MQQQFAKVRDPFLLLGICNRYLVVVISSSLDYYQSLIFLASNAIDPTKMKSPIKFDKPFKLDKVDSLHCIFYSDDDCVTPVTHVCSLVDDKENGRSGEQSDRLP